MDAKIVFRRHTGSVFEEMDIIFFSFSKNVYTPYTSLTASVSTTWENYEDISEIMLYVGEKLVHHGLADRVERTVSGTGNSVVTISSSGFTSQLLRNQLEPGLKMGVSINSLFDGFYTLPRVTHEDNSDTSNYIYVKNGSNLWDGIVSLSYKLCGTYPFIHGANCVRMNPPENPVLFEFSDSELTERGSGSSVKKLVSNFHMADINNEYGKYELAVEYAEDRKIVRHSFFELDKQFLYDPEGALRYRMKYTRRGAEWDFCRYPGYRGEDLSDLASFGSVSKKRICGVEIKGDSSGIFTKLYVYSDGFFNT